MSQKMTSARSSGGRTMTTSLQKGVQLLRTSYNSQKKKDSRPAKLVSHNSLFLDYWTDMVDHQTVLIYIQLWLLKNGERWCRFLSLLWIMNSEKFTCCLLVKNFCELLTFVFSVRPQLCRATKTIFKKLNMTCKKKNFLRVTDCKETLTWFDKVPHFRLFNENSEGILWDLISDLMVE